MMPCIMTDGSTPPTDSAELTQLPSDFGSQEAVLAFHQRILEQLEEKLQELTSTLRTCNHLQIPRGTEVASSTETLPVTANPLRWRPLLVTPERRQKTTYADFCKRFEAVFSYPRTSHVTSDHLLHLRQGNRTVAKYTLEFWTLVEQSRWSETSLLTCFMNGLQPWLQKELMYRGEDWTLDCIVETAVAIKNLSHAQAPRGGTAIPTSILREEDLEPLRLGQGGLNPKESKQRFQAFLCFSWELLATSVPPPQGAKLGSLDDPRQLTVSALDRQLLGSGVVDSCKSVLRGHIGACHQEDLAFSLIGLLTPRSSWGFPGWFITTWCSDGAQGSRSHEASDGEVQTV
ncbi:hypothetical protein Z043_115694, partial [Scleropages formosus]